MIEKLFSSRALYATLAIFFDYPNDTLYPRLICRQAGVDIKCVLRELKKLEGMGVVISRRTGKGKYFRLKESFPLHEELASIFMKTRNRRRYASRGLMLHV